MSSNTDVLSLLPTLPSLAAATFSVNSYLLSCCLYLLSKRWPKGCATTRFLLIRSCRLTQQCTRMPRAPPPLRGPLDAPAASTATEPTHAAQVVEAMPSRVRGTLAMGGALAASTRAIRGGACVLLPLLLPAPPSPTA